MARSFMMILLLPLAIPGALLHLPVGWVAAAVGERFSYELDDIATLKVFATMLLLPILYLAVGIYVGMNFGAWWALASILVLSFSFAASLQLLEAETSLLMSMLSILRVTRLSHDVDELRGIRASLVEEVRELTERMADPDAPRMFTKNDFNKPDG